MKLLPYLLSIGILIAGIDFILIPSAHLHACPRCRRALPKGPRKRPHPGFPKKDTKPNYVANNVNINGSDNAPTNNTKGELNE